LLPFFALFCSSTQGLERSTRILVFPPFFSDGAALTQRPFFFSRSFFLIDCFFFFIRSGEKFPSACALHAVWFSFFSPSLCLKERGDLPFFFEFSVQNELRPVPPLSGRKVASRPRFVVPPNFFLPIHRDERQSPSLPPRLAGRAPSVTLPPPSFFAFPPSLRKCHAQTGRPEPFFFFLSAFHSEGRGYRPFFCLFLPTP